MIAFDNGPAHGDYARYIDDLMARAALATSSATSASASSAIDDSETTDDLMRRARERSGAVATTGRSRSADAIDRQPGDADRQAGARRTRAATSRESGFATPVASSTAAVTAAAVASALMSGQVGPRAALSLATLAALAAVVVGSILVVAGVLWHPFNLAIVVGGVALVTWAFRRLKGSGIGTGRKARG